MMLLTSAAAIALTCLAFLGYEFVEERRDARGETATVARLLAANSTAALAFRDTQDAQEVLHTLAAERDFKAAVLYDKDGAFFASYIAPGASNSVPMKPLQDGFDFQGSFMEGFEPVIEGQQRFGTLFLRYDMGSVYADYWAYVAIALPVLAASLLLSFIISGLLHRRVSQPLLALADTARAISERGDFKVRAASGGEATEFRMLTEAFNHMLARIESQNAAVGAQLGRLDLLQRTTRAIAERHDLQSVFQVILRNLEDNLPISFGCICLYDAHSPALTVDTIGAKSQRRANQIGIDIGTRLPIDVNGLARAVSGRLVYEPDVKEVAFPFPQQLAAAGLRSVVAAPLIVESEVFGVLLAARHEPHAFDSPDCEFLRQLSEHVALAAHQVQLHTALTSAYDELRRSQQTVLQQERLRALGQMASGIAHDINNAISPIALYVELLLTHETELSQRARGQLEIVQRAVADVGQTVARMRDFYRQRDEQHDLAPLELNPLIEQVLELTRARWYDMAQERGEVITVRCDLAAELPRIMGNESDIRDALTNLVFNAVDAMPNGGTLSLRTKRTREDEVTFEVADTGAGMDEDTRRRCFEPFFTTKGERGTGMGLAMVYGMVRRHGGDIAIDSALGEGTTVRIRFAVAAQLTQAVVEPVDLTTKTRSLRLLVVDDDPLVTQTLYEVLRADGHRPVAADGGQEGIDAFTAALRSAEPFDLVMTDLGMPYVDGRAVAAAIKRLSPQTPIVMLTGWGQRLLLEQDVPPYVDRLIGKPPKLAELRRALAELSQQAAPVLDQGGD